MGEINAAFGFGERLLAVAPGATHHRFAELVTRHWLIGPGFWKLTEADEDHLGPGLRRSADPGAYFRENALAALTAANRVDLLTEAPRTDHCLAELAEAGHYRLTGRRTRTDLREFEPDTAAQLLACTVNYLGSWADAVEMVEPIDGRLPRTPEDARLLTLAATVLAVDGSPRCRELFAAAADRWDDPLERFFTLLRAATAEVRWLNDPKYVDKALTEAEDAALVLTGYGHTEDTRAYAQGLVWNVAAVCEVKAGQHEYATWLLREGWQLISACEPERVAVTPAAFDRTVTRLRRNKGMFAGAVGDVDTAIDIFRICADVALEPPDQAEALCLLGSALLRDGRQEEALDVLLAAEKPAYDGVSPSVLRQVRRLLALAQENLGDQAGARRTLAARQAGYAVPPRAIRLDKGEGPYGTADVPYGPLTGLDDPELF